MPRFNEKPEQLRSLIDNSEGPLASIAHKSQLLSKVASVIQQLCPDLPIESYRLANISAHGIVIEAKSPVWGQRLQFEKNNLLRELNKLIEWNVTTLDIKVVPFGYVKTFQEPATKKKEMSQTAADQLMMVAENAPKGLKEKIERLAQHANKKN